MGAFILAVLFVVGLFVVYPGVMFSLVAVTIIAVAMVRRARSITRQPAIRPTGMPVAPRRSPAWGWEPPPADHAEAMHRYRQRAIEGHPDPTAPLRTWLGKGEE